jgi:hypothetical protein
MDCETKLLQVVRAITAPGGLLHLLISGDTKRNPHDDEAQDSGDFDFLSQAASG